MVAQPRGPDVVGGGGGGSHGGVAVPEGGVGRGGEVGEGVLGGGGDGLVREVGRGEGEAGRLEVAVEGEGHVGGGRGGGAGGGAEGEGAGGRRGVLGTVHTCGGGQGRGEVISKGRGLLTLENCSEVLAATRINQCVRRSVQRPSPLSALAIKNRSGAHTCFEKATGAFYCQLQKNGTIKNIKSRWAHGIT